MIDRYAIAEMRAVWSDEARVRALLRVELEYLKAIARDKRIPARELAAFERRAASVSPREVARLEAKTQHDVVALLEAAVGPIERRVPTLSRFLHYGLTSSDLLDTALALQASQAADLLHKESDRLALALGALANRSRGLPSVSRTHGIHAEPTSFALKWAGFYAEALRNHERLREVRESIRFGKLSGAVGNFAHTRPEWEARALKALGLKPEPLATQVVPRDRHAEFLSAVALAACSVERLALEIRHLQRTEVGEAAEPFGEGQKGSSAMPHKQNPVLSENLCGLARLVRAYASAALENVALWHERDISHSSVERVAFPDATIALHFMLRRAAIVVEGLRVDRGRVRENLDRTKGLVYSQRVLLALADKGLSRAAAYRIVQRTALRAFEDGAGLAETLRDDPEASKLLKPADLDVLFSPEAYLRREGVLLRRAGL